MKKIIPALALSLAVLLSCGPRLNNSATVEPAASPTIPKKVVDVPALLGKSREEIKRLLGPPKREDQYSLNYKFDPAGSCSIKFDLKGEMERIDFETAGFQFDTAEEFGDLSGIDLRGLTPAESNMNSSQASVAGPEARYKDLSLNGVKVRELVFKNQFGRKGFNWFILFMPSY